MIGVTEQTYDRWRKEYSGVDLEQVRRVRELEVKNPQLKKLVANLSLDNQISKEVSRGKLLSSAKGRMAVEHVLE